MVDQYFCYLAGLSYFLVYSTFLQWSTHTLEERLYEEENTVELIFFFRTVSKQMFYFSNLCPIGCLFAVICKFILNALELKVIVRGKIGILPIIP